MKLPNREIVSDILPKWKEAAIQFGIDYGVYIEAVIDYYDSSFTPNYSKPPNVVFIIDDINYQSLEKIKFQSLNDLKKAITNFKAFI